MPQLCAAFTITIPKSGNTIYLTAITPTMTNRPTSDLRKPEKDSKGSG